MTTIATRDHLPFVRRDREGDLHHWSPVRQHGACYETTTALGNAWVDTLGQLARVDEHEAYIATLHALLSPNWSGECGEEEGFADALARVAVIGWRALRAADGEVTVKGFDPSLARWCSLLTRLEVMEAQLKSPNVTPWRTMEEARPRA
jgi:hypothetical protein